MYADLSDTTLADWLSNLSHLVLGAKNSGKHGYLLFEHASDDKMRPVDGHTLGKLLHDHGTPLLVLNACQSAMHEATDAPKSATDVHNEIRAIGSLSQAVIDQGIPAVLGMRYSVYVVTAAQYIGELYAALAKGRSFGQSATDGRKHLYLNPDRWVGLGPRPLQDWFVPVVYEASPIEFFPPGEIPPLGDQPELDPVQNNTALLRYVPEEGFIGRDETILALDRAFDDNRVVLLHAYAGQGKSCTAVEFSRWYSITGGLGPRPIVLFASFESQKYLADLLNQIAQKFDDILERKGVQWSALNDAEKRITEVKKLLREFPVLWIWDNVEPVAGFPEGTQSQWTADEQRELRDFLHQIKEDPATKVKILLTSRRDEKKWLGGIVKRVPMPRMSDSDAAKLALKLGKDKGLQRSQIAAWQPLLDYCRGNPLTLRVLVGQAVRLGLKEEDQIEKFVEDIRSGEQQIEDADERQGRDKSLGASLDYGFRNAFSDDELPIVALLHLFQGTVDVDALLLMGEVEDHALPELKGKSKEHLTALLQRAKEIGLLTHLHATWFTIHPALPWFLRQLFARHYDGKAGRSDSQAALRAWVEAVGELGSFYHNQFGEGNRGAIDLLELEEANLLHARRLARRNEWSLPVMSCMQGLRVLYEYLGRIAEWTRLVEEIVPDYCTIKDGPISGREDHYSFVMSYRVRLAHRHEHGLDKAAALQEKCVEFDRRQAAVGLALPSDAPLDNEQRHHMRTLCVSVFTLGQVQREEGNAACLESYQQSLEIAQRIGDKAAQASIELDLGTAYLDVPGILDLDAAEAACRRSLDLRAPNDALGRSRCMHQIGMVHHARLKDALQRDEPEETLLRHVRAAEGQYLQGLQLRPKDALTELAPSHAQMGNLYAEVGEFDTARKHLEQSAQYHEKGGNRLGAGKTRVSISIMYAQGSRLLDETSQKRDYLFRAKAYAEAALRDFEYYEGRAAAEEANANALIEQINEALAKLPE